MAKFRLEDAFELSSEVHNFRAKVKWYFSENKSQMQGEDKRKYRDLIDKLYMLEDALEPFAKEYLTAEEDE